MFWKLRGMLARTLVRLTHGVLGMTELERVCEYYKRECERMEKELEELTGENYKDRFWPNGKPPP